MPVKRALPSQEDSRRGRVSEFVSKLGAVVVGQLPDVGGGAFGAARLAHIVAARQSGTVAVPVTGVTIDKLIRLAEKASTAERKVDPVEVAARLLEGAVAAVSDV
jgi:hypothetical protein